MFYIIWLITIALAVGLGIFAALKVDKHDERKN